MSDDKKRARKPETFRPAEGADSSEIWKDFKKSFGDYAFVEDLYKECPQTQVAIFRGCLGDNNRQLLRTLGLGDIVANVVATPGRPCRTLQIMLETLDKQFAAHENIHLHRHMYSKLRQSENEQVKDFVNRILRAVKPCKFTSEKELIIHQLISGTSLEAARRIIFEADQTKVWTTEQVVATLKQVEANNAQLPAFRASGNEAEEKVNRLSERKSGQKIQQKKKQQTGNDKWNAQPMSQQGRRVCAFCGSGHPPRQCPAYGYRCQKCQRNNHFESVCGSGSKQQAFSLEETEQWNQQKQNGGADEEHEIFTVSKEETKPKNKFFALLKLPAGPRVSTTRRAQIDSGATVSAMSLVTYQKVQAAGGVANPLDERRATTLKTYNNMKMTSAGEFTMQCEYDGRRQMIPFQVLRETVDTLLSGRACVDMEIIKLHGGVEHAHRVESLHSATDLVAEYENIFKGPGCLQPAVEIQIDPTVTPRQAAPRRPAIATRDAFIDRRRRMERDDIIVKNDYPTPWISNSVVVPKADGSVRITLDPAELNKAIRRPRYAMPTLEEHLSMLTKAKWFTICDAKDGFFQLPLHPLEQDWATFFLRSYCGEAGATTLYLEDQLEMDFAQLFFVGILSSSAPFWNRDRARETNAISSHFFRWLKNSSRNSPNSLLS